MGCGERNIEGLFPGLTQEEVKEKYIFKDNYSLQKFDDGTAKFEISGLEGSSVYYFGAYSTIHTYKIENG